MEPSVRPATSGYKPGMPDRRHRQPDIWARIFRYLTVLIYPLLIVFFFIFFGIASSDHSQAVAAQLVGPAAPEAASKNPVDWGVFLPILIAGALIGTTGLVLSRKRARRRSDYNYQTQCLLTILSVGGLAIFFLLR